MANDSIELGRIRAKVLRLEDKTDKLTIVDTTASFDQTVSITGNLYVNGELLNVSVADITSSINTLKADLTASYARLAIANTFTANQTITGTVAVSSHITGNGNMYIGGNVGIGTNTPSSPLHLKSTGPIQFIIEADTDNAIESDNANILLKQDGGAVQAEIGMFDSENILRINNMFGDALWLGTSDTPRLYINNAGSVGIGTTSPSTTMDIRSTNLPAMRLSSSWNNGVVGLSDILFGDLSNNAGFSAGFLKNLSSPADSLFHITPYGSAQGNIFSIGSNGNVGIGTTNPTKLLHVSASTLDPVIIENNSDGNFNRILYKKPSRMWSIGQTAGNDLGIADETANVGHYRFFIDSNGRVGINGNSATTLTVNCTRSVNDGIIINNTNADYQSYLLLNATGSSVWQLGKQGAASSHQFFLWDQTGGRNVLIANRGTNGALILQPLNGNVGVGTTNPAQKLDIRGGTEVNAQIYADTAAATRADLRLRVNNSTGDSYVLFGDSATFDIGRIQYNYNSDYMALYTDSAERLRITSAGNVGIGTTNPGANLHVKGNGNVARLEGTDHAYIEWYPDGPTIRKAYTGFPDSTANYFIITNEINTGDGHVILQPGTNANVGVGTTSPGAKLHVLSTVSNDGLHLAGTSNLWSSFRINMGNGSYNNIVSANDRGIIYGGASFGNPGGGFVIAPWATGPSGLKVDSTGSVGIGTTSPGAKLDVVGSAIISANTSNAALRITQVGSGEAIRVEDSTNPDSTPFVVDTAGNVGVGLANPSRLLHVYSNVNSDSILIQNGTDANFNRIRFGKPSKTYAVGQINSNDFAISDETAGSYRMLIDSTGRIGVGLTNPARQLSLVGQISVVSGGVGEDVAYNGSFISTRPTTTSQHINLIKSGTKVWSIGFKPGGTEFLIAGGQSTDSDFGNNQPFCINSAGNVGIGTTNPTGAKLQVVGGDALINGVKVGAGGGNNVLNACLGSNALDATAGSYTTAIGRGALSSSTGAQNTAVGGLAGNAISTGNGNTAIGYTSLYTLTTGTNNTALGINALKFLQNGANNTTSSNCTGVGNDSRIAGNNEVQLGNSSTTTYAYGAVANRSDRRDKADIEDTDLGLQFINLLRPVEYRWDYREDYFDKIKEEVKTILEDGTEIINLEEKLIPVAKDGSRKRKRKHQGLIAQEVKEVMDKLNIDFAGYQDHKINGGLDVLSMGYTEFIGPLIKSIQELSSQNDYLKNKLEEKDKQIEDILLRLAALEGK